MPRTEDQRMVTGHGRYIDDLKKAGMVHAAFVRSTVARGRILEVDASEARKMPGVIMVLTAAETNSPEHELAGRPPDNTPRTVRADQ
jgi:carbon-monoxide dehydrogenase large subunit